MLPPIPSRYTFGTTVPLYESNQIEFKENSISFEKLKKTVCAFLNSIGGYIFIGIADDRRIVGITDRLADRYSLFVDQLISGRSIIRIGTNSASQNERQIGGADLTVGEVRTQIIELAAAPEPAVILLIVVQPHSIESDYMWATGERYFRLNASNYCRRDDAIELVQLKERFSLLKSDCGKLNSQLTMMTHELRKSLVGAAKAVATRDEVLDLLFEKILCEKRAAEKALQPKDGWLWCLLKCTL